MPHDAAGLPHQRIGDQVGRVLETPKISEALGLPKHLSACRSPPPAPEHVPDSRDQHGASSGHSKSPPPGFDAASRLPYRALYEGPGCWLVTTMTELVVEKDQLSRRLSAGWATSAYNRVCSGVKPRPTDARAGRWVAAAPAADTGRTPQEACARCPRSWWSTTPIQSFRSWRPFSGQPGTTWLRTSMGTISKRRSSRSGPTSCCSTS